GRTCGVRCAWAIVPPNAPVAARSRSTWIHWWSSVASANRSTRSWVISTHSVVPISSPRAASISPTVPNVRMELLGWKDVAVPDDISELIALDHDLVRRAPKVLLHDHL